MPDYSHFDGSPVDDADHREFRFDAWRALSNVALDYSWYADDPWQTTQSNRVLKFLAAQGQASYPNQYSLAGNALSADHSTGLSAMSAVAALAADRGNGKPFVLALWDAPIPDGKWRYYDGRRYQLGLLQASGCFHAYLPAELASHGRMAVRTFMNSDVKSQIRHHSKE